MKQVTLQDAKIINDFYKKSDSELGYNSFIGTYSTCLGHGEKLFYEIIEDVCFYILGEETDPEKNIVPLYLGVRPNKGATIIKEYSLKHKIQYGSYIDKQYVPHIEAVGIKMSPAHEAAHEALYPVERFKTFQNISNAKRQAHLFLKGNTFKFVPYKEEYANQVIKIAQEWERETSHPTDGCDVVITKFFTEIYDSLPALGFVLLVDNKVIAYLFGEVINHQTFIINAVKAKKEYKGVYQALYHLVSKVPALQDVQYINGTNLTEVPGLRESKLRLKPSRLIIPWECEINS